MSNKTRTTLYIGVTNDLERRVQEHRNGQGEFTSRYRLFHLIYFEEIHGTFSNAIKREKQLKRWHREWKLNLIRSVNPALNDLASYWGLEIVSPDPETSSG